MIEPICKSSIHILDEHNECLLLWEEIFSKSPSRKRRKLLHVDNHFDMNAPLLSKSIYTAKIKNLINDIGIASFITPALLKGYFNEVILFAPKATKKPITKKYIGTIYGEGKIIKSELKLNKINKT